MHLVKTPNPKANGKNKKGSPKIPDTSLPITFPHDIIAHPMSHTTTTLILGLHFRMTTFLKLKNN